MSEEQDIKDFERKAVYFTQPKQIDRDFLEIIKLARELNERSALYIEFMAAAFMQETGLKASECELIYWIDSIDRSMHWRFQKVAK